MKSLVQKRWKKEESNVPLYQQVASFLASAINSGEIPPNYTLPGHRQLAGLFGVGIHTILHALHILQKLQLVSSSERSRTVVLKKTSSSANWDKFMGSSSYNTANQHFFSSAEAHRECLNLSMGLDKDYYFRNLFNDVLQDLRIPAVMKTSPFGLPALREKICEYMRKYGINAHPEQVMMVTSITHALNVIFVGLLGRKTTLLVAKPCHLQISNLAKATGSKIAELELDEQGIIPHRLTKAIEKYSQCMLCISPDCNVPTGTTTSLKRREEILKICSHAGVPIIEHTIFPQGCTLNNLPSLKSLDTAQSVVHISQISVSASTNPWLGWIIVDEYLLQRLNTIRFSFDAHQNYLMQVAALEVFSRGLYDKYLSNIEAVRTVRQEFVKKILNQYLADYASWNDDNIDACIWLKFNKEISTRRLYSDAVDITFQPGWFYGEQFSDRIYLSPLALSPENLEIGIQALVHLIRLQLN